MIENIIEAMQDIIKAAFSASDLNYCSLSPMNTASWSYDNCGDIEYIPNALDYIIKNGS